MAWLFVAFWLAGCEDLEDTYDEFAGDGMIRYVGKCSEADFDVVPGWERLRVTWKNNLDAAIKWVKITYQSENEQEPKVILIDRMNEKAQKERDTLWLEGLQNVLYTVQVSNVSIDSVESLVVKKEGRPYTYEHEDLRSFTLGMSSYYRLGNRLAVVLDNDNDAVSELKLVFQGTDGQEHEWNIKEHMRDSLLYWGMIPVERDYIHLIEEEIDFTKDVLVERKGKIDACIDTIEFKSEKLDLQTKRFSTMFSRMMRGRYGADWESRTDEFTEIEVDYSITSLLDLLYFPNLKKVVLGKNRYMHDSYSTQQRYMSSTDVYSVLTVLQFLKDTREDFTIEHYNKHFFTSSDIYDYQDYGKLKDDFAVEEKGNANMQEMPSITPLDTANWEVTYSNSGNAADTLRNGYAEDGVAWLLYDGVKEIEDDWGWTEEKEMYFQPLKTFGSSIITVTMDMKQAKILKGFKVVQPVEADKDLDKYLLSSMQVEVSGDGLSWSDATEAEGAVSIGNSPGEITFLEVAGALRSEPVRYIRLTMNSNLITTESGVAEYNLRLQAFIPY